MHWQAQSYRSCKVVAAKDKSVALWHMISQYIHLALIKM